MPAPLVLILGAGELGTACALRLTRAGFSVFLMEEEKPFDIYQSRAFSSAVYLGNRTIEGITVRTMGDAIAQDIITEKATTAEFVSYESANREIALIHPSQWDEIQSLKFQYVVATKASLFSHERFAKWKVIGFSGEIDVVNFSYTVCDKGLFLGRVIYPFLAEHMQHHASRIRDEKPGQRIKAPIEGVFEARKQINDVVFEKEVLASIAGIPILSPERGRVTGLLNSGVIVPAGLEFMEISPLHSQVDGTVIPPGSFAQAGAVLEAIRFDRQLDADK